MSQELEDEVRRLFDNFDRLDFDAVAATLATDVQGVDELSRRWMRGKGELTSYFEQMRPLLSNIKSSLSDVRAVTWGDAGVVTCWLEQTYNLEGRTESISAPTTFVFRREGEQWRVALIHSIPQAEEA
jgi:ketosteroid isomerase-like protein